MRTIGHWTGQDCRAFQQAAGLTNERLAQRLNVSVRAVAYWRKQTTEVLPDLAQRALAKALADASDPVRRRFEVIVDCGQSVWADSVDTVIAAAASAAESDLLLLTAGFDPESLAWLWDEARAIARAGNRPAVETFTAAGRLRHQALELAGRTRRPADLSDLYVVIGQATALMASTAFDLNHWDASAVLAHSAVSYASLARHDSLQAWTLGLAALLANWRDEPDAALRHLQHGLQIAPAGMPRLRLRYIEARSFARLGAAAEVKQALGHARRDQQDAEQHHDSLSEETGGEFSFGPARAEACAAAAWLDLGFGHEAQEAAERALEELTAQPAGRQAFSQVSGARIDLASARLINRDRDGVADIIQHVLAVPPSLRNMSLSGRLARLRNMLASGPWTEDRQAQRLSEEITAWMSDRPDRLSA